MGRPLCPAASLDLAPCDLPVATSASQCIQQQTAQSTNLTETKSWVLLAISVHELFLIPRLPGVQHIWEIDRGHFQHTL
jgi:hypothetical protein